MKTAIGQLRLLAVASLALIIPLGLPKSWLKESPRNGRGVSAAGGLRVVATIVTAASGTTTQLER